MFSTFERLVAARYLRAKKQEGFVSVTAGFSFAGIMLGVATLIIVMSVMNGFRAELFTRILGLNGHMNVYTTARPFYDYGEVRAKLQALDGIDLAIPTVEGQALVNINGHASGVIVRGMDAFDFARKPILSHSVIEGDIKNFEGHVVAIGTEMAKRNGLRVGDTITLIAPKGKSGPFGTIPRSRSYQIAMIFDTGMFEYNSSFVFTTLDSAQKFFQMPQSVSSLEIFTTDPHNLDPIKDEAGLVIDGIAHISDWRDVNSSFLDALTVERNVMFLILTLIIVVAAFNIISSMIMLVKDKGQDIAIMRTMGASRRNMLKIFMMTGASIGLVGTAIGAALGIIIAVNLENLRDFIESTFNTELFPAEIYFLTQLPSKVDWTEVVVVIVMALGLSVLATVYPAMRASRLDPVEALRYE